MRLELRSFVRVVVGLAGGKSAVGTGYRLREDRILTAAHVVEDAEAITVEHDLEDGTVVADDAEVVWIDEGLDVAVLACSPSPAPFTHIAPGPLASRSSWESRGCARAALAGASVADSMAPLAGKAYAVAEHQDRFELEVEAPPADVKDWSGISGAPVFVDGRIYGVLRAAPTVFAARRLHATPIHRLLTIDDFVDAAGLRQANRWEGLLAEARTLLAEDREAAAAVAAQNDRWRQVLAKDGGEGLATEICERGRVDQVLVGMHKAHHALLAKGRQGPARTIEKVLALIVPVLYDRQLVYSLPGAGGVVLQVPVATQTIAEIVMAGVGARGYRYRRMDDPQRYPEPVGSVAGFPEPGIDFTGDRAFKDFVDHLAAAFLPEEDRHHAAKGRQEEERYDALLRLLQGELEHRAQDHVDGLHRYFLFDSDLVRDHAPFLAHVRGSLPALRLVELTGGDVPGERLLCRPLRDLLYQSTENRS
ncbi:MAG: serine protease [Thermoanaerobaculia bacterium]